MQLKFCPYKGSTLDRKLSGQTAFVLFRPLPVKALMVVKI